jgi:cytidyltransferase-like protein
MIDGTKRVFVTGCFDPLHPGHIAFLRSAERYGDVYVSIGSDDTIRGLKNREPFLNELERKTMIEELRSVKKVLIGSGSGIIDFADEIEEVKPDVFVVNEDGDSKEKMEFCQRKGIEYVVLPRIPLEGLPHRSSTELRGRLQEMPYRIDLAGGWLDQPWVSMHYPGPVIVASLNPTHYFNDRSGMATSTRKRAIRLWQGAFPQGRAERELAEILFAFDNPPGTKAISGSQDAFGIVLPGINRLMYNGEYLPSEINSLNDDKIISWVESKIKLVSLGPRFEGYDVLAKTNIDKKGAKLLSEAAEDTWKSINKMDVKYLGDSMRRSFEAQIKMFPNMTSPEIESKILEYKDKSYGWKLSGAGGGGYIVLVTEDKIPGSLEISIRRKI